MKKIILFIFFHFLYSFSFAQEVEEIRIVTYYPAPYGSYTELTTERMKIGPTFSQSGTTVGDGNLIVENNVAIGTDTPISGVPGSDKILTIGGTNPTLRFDDLDVGDNDMEIHVQNGEMGFYELSTLRMMLKGGYLGIGTDSPSDKLTVEEGVINIRSAGGALKFTDTNENDAGQIRLATLSVKGLEFLVDSNGDKIAELIAMNIDPDGNVGIGTTNPEAKLHILDTSDGSSGGSAPAGSDRLVIEGGFNAYINEISHPNAWGGILFSDDVRGRGSIKYGHFNDVLEINVAGSSAMSIDKSGNITGTYGSYHVASDERLKKDITTIQDALDKVLSLRGVNFHWKDSNLNQGKLRMGLVAQEVEKVVPEVVHTVDDEMQTKAVEYQYLVGLLIEAIKDQQKQINNLKTEVEILKNN
ncbi:MAG: tail fiber domain-containing protein [Candidatus Gygaella obscura]|nr:tail fiber domain-containing protein [Candidatus Gygaella obscura]